MFAQQNYFELGLIPRAVTNLQVTTLAHPRARLQPYAQAWVLARQAQHRFVVNRYYTPSLNTVDEAVDVVRTAGAVATTVLEKTCYVIVCLRVC